jgi:large subunit ribosomal protein L35
MPKLKTKKGVKKRFKVTKKGKIKRHHSGCSHILTKKSSKRKRKLRHDDLVNKVDKKKVKKLLPYS